MGDDIRQKAASMEAKVAAAAALSVPAVKQVYTAGKLVAEGVEAVAKAIDSNTPGTFATPNGATLTGALEAAPTAVGVGEAMGVGKTLTAGILPPDDFTSLSFARKADGRDSSSKVHSQGRPEIVSERKVDTPEMRNSFWDQLKQSGEWEHVSKYEKSTLRHKETGRLIQKSIEKWEIEVYNEKERHIGVIKPSDGILRKDLAVKGRTIEK
jgi:hypothetical protein